MSFQWKNSTVRKSLCILTGGSRIKQAAGDYLELCSDRRRESKEAVEVDRTSESLYGSCSNVASKKCAQPQFACGSTSASISIKRQRGADVFPLGLLVSKLAVARGREVSQSEIRNRSANDNWSTCLVHSACLGVLKWTEHEGFGLGGSLFAHARYSNRPIKDPTCSYTNSSTFLSRALKETALWQDATPISQNRDWIEWMSCETAADLKHCYKSQTARSAAARLGRDRQPDSHFTPSTMSSAENQQHAFPAAPPSLSAGDHEMRNYYATQDVPRPSSDQTSYLTPYLGLRARLSQVWINRWTILILLVLIRALLAIGSVNTNLTSAKREALSACTGVENVGSAMASMPYYMSSGVNELTASGIEKAINGLMSMLLLSITVLEEVFVFYINLLTSTYVCLFTFAIGGSLHVAIDVAEDVGDFLNSTAKSVGTELGDAMEDFQKAMNKFTGAIEDVGSFFTGKNVDVPEINLNSSIAKLDTFQLPSGYDKGLDKMNDSIPTFAEVHNATNKALRFPFEEVKQLLNESMGRYTMNRSMFHVPPKEKLTFCSDDDGINDFFDDLADVITLAKKIFLSVLIIAAILACVPMAYREIRRWNLQEERARAIKHINDPMDAVYIVSRPYTADFGVKVSNHFSSTRARTLVRWTVAYATTVPALFVLCLAIAGLLGCLCQFILLQAIRKEVPELTQKVDAFADKVEWSLNNASLAWAVDTNHVINTTNTKINEDIFGWVNTTTGAVNNTLNIFVDGMNDAINDTFGGTILEDPVKEVVNCLITLKIQGIQSALTWVSDHAHVDFPMVRNDTFSLGTMDKVNDTSSGNSSMLAEGDSLDAGDAISRAILFVVHALEKAVRQEAIISTCVLLIWVLIVLIGLIRAGYMLAHADNEPAPADHYPNELKSMPPQSFSATHASRSSFSRRNSSISSRVPTYEQATSATTVDTSDNSANRLNGQSYTLSPRKFQLSDYPGVTSPILSSGFSPSEKVGFVGAQNVEAATRRPTHIRASSHGNFVEGTSPVDKTPTSPQRSNTHLQPQDPFADHAR